MTRTRFTTLAALLLAALILSGCGGGSGGDGSSLQDQIDMLTMERDDAQAERDDAQAERDDAQAEVTSLKDEVTRLEGELTTAENRVMQLETLIGDAVNPASASLRGQLATAQAEAARLRGELTAAQGQVSEAEQRASEAEEEADRRIEEAEQQVNASLRIANLLDSTDNKLDLSADAANTASATVTHAPGESLVFQPTGNWPNRPTAPSITGWRSGGFSRSVGVTGTETAYLYTNIGSPSRKHFWKVHGNQVDSPIATDAAVSFGNDRSLYQNAQGAPQNRDSASQAGTYDGYSGTFSCTEAGACNMAHDASMGI